MKYPENILNESNEASTDSLNIKIKAEQIIEEDFNQTNSISHKYRNEETEGVIREINELRGMALAFNVSLKEKYNALNTKHNYIVTQNSNVLSLKSKLPRHNGKLMDLTYDILRLKRDIEEVIKESSKDIQELRVSYQELKELMQEIERLKIEVTQKKDKLRQLYEEEEKRNKMVIDEIRRNLEEIKRILSNLRTIIDLKGNAKEELEIIGKFIAETSFNDEKYKQKKQELDEKMNSALQNLFVEGKIEEHYESISQFLTDKEALKYEDYSAENLNTILNDTKQKFSEIDNVHNAATAIVREQMSPTTSEILKFKNDIATFSITDLFGKIKKSYETFNNTIISLSESMGAYKEEKEKLENCENDIKRRKNKIMDYIIEEDNDTIEKTNTCEGITDPESFIFNKKKQIETYIYDNRGTIGTVKDHLVLFATLEKYFAMSEETQTISDLQSLQKSINTAEMDAKMNDYDLNLTETTNSINSSINNIELLKAIIENVKILNKILNGYDSNNELINDLKRRAESLKSRIDEEIIIITNENVIEQDVKDNFLSKLNEEKRSVERETSSINELGEKLIEIERTSKDLKSKVNDSTTIQNVEQHSSKILLQESSYKDVTDNISKIKVSIDLLNTKVDNSIRIQNDEISNIIHKLITKLHEQIDNEAQGKLSIIDEIQGNIEILNSESNIENVSIESHKESLRTISQSIKNLIGIVMTHKSKVIEIRQNCKDEFERSNDKMKNIENLNDKIKDMKEIYNNMKQLYDELSKEIQNLEHSLTNINQKKIEYKKELLYYIVSQVIDKKENANQEIIIIDEINNKIKQLKENTKDASYSELENFNCEGYVSKAINSQGKISKLVEEVNALREEAESAKTENDIDSIQEQVEYKLKEVIKEKSIIDISSKEIQDIENILMLKQFNSIMENIKLFLQKSEQQKLIVEGEFKKSESIKKELLYDFKRAEDLKKALNIKKKENFIDADIQEIRRINDSFETKVGNIYGFLTACEQHNEACKLHHHNIKRGKIIIEYIKNHNHDKEKKITQNIIDEISGYVYKSENHMNEADNFVIGTREIYELCSEYKSKMNNLFNESLILGENIKFEIKKNEINDILVIIKSNYTAIKTIVEKLEEKLSRLKEEHVLIEEKNKEQANNKKSIDAFGQIKIIKTISGSLLGEIEALKQRVGDILVDSENAFESLSTNNKTDKEDFYSKLKMEEENIKKALEVLTKMKSNKNLISNELDKIKENETKVASMENEMELSKISYEEGILEEIKINADKEKESMEHLISLINTITENAITFLEEFKLEEDNIAQQFEDNNRTLNAISDSFDMFYKNIEEIVSEILKSATTYDSIKEKRENAQREIENLGKQKEEMEKLLNNNKDIKKKETLRLIFHMKHELDNVSKKAEEEYSQVKTHIEGMNMDVKNLKSLDSASSALIELNNVKKKDGEIRQNKITYSFYKDKIYVIYSNMNKAMAFIDMSIEEISNLGDHESIKDIEDIIPNTQKKLSDIEEKVGESITILEKANSIYEQIKFREELKERIIKEIEKIANTFPTIEAALEKSKKIKEMKFEEQYDTIFKISNDNDSVKGLLNDFTMKLREMDRELKINSIRTELEEKKSALNDLEQHLESSKEVEYAVEILEEARGNLDIIVSDVDGMRSTVLEIDRSLDELLEIGKNYKLSLKSIIITSVQVEITKDMLIIQKLQKDVVSCVEYIKNNYNSIIEDIIMLNKRYSTEAINNHESMNVVNANKFSEEFSKKEKEATATSSDVQQLFSTMNECKDANKVDEYLNKLKGIYEKFHKEKTSINEIFRNVNDSRLKEMEKISEKFLEIAKFHRTIVEEQNKKFIDNKNKMKEIEDFLKEREVKVGDMDYKDEEYMKKFNEYYQEINDKLRNMSELQNDNSNENNIIMVYKENISYLIGKIRTLLRDAELYEHDKGSDLSEEMKILDDENDYIHRIKEKGNEAKTILENIETIIEKSKNFYVEISALFSSIGNIMKHVNEIKENYEREENELKNKKKIRNYVLEDMKKEDEFISMSNDTGESFKHSKENHVLNESSDKGIEDPNKKNNTNGKNKFDGRKGKLAGGILVGLLISSGIVISVVYKRKNNENNMDNSGICEEYETGNCSFDKCERDEAINVTFEEYE